MAKGGSAGAGKEEPKTPVKERSASLGKEPGGIDFFYILAGGGILIGILLFVFMLLRYVLHVL